MEYPPVSVVMPVRNEERHLAESVRHVLGPGLPGPGRAAARRRALGRPDGADRAGPGRRRPADHGRGQPERADPGRPQRRPPRRAARDHRAGGRARAAAARLPEDRGGDAGRDRRRRRRRGHGGRRRDLVPAGRGVGDDLQGGGGLGRVPHRRRSRADAQRLPRRVPPGGHRAGRRVGRGDAPRGGLGAELPHPGPRRRDLVHPRAARHLPARGTPCAPSAPSTSTTAAGGGSSSASTRRRPASVTWPRRARPRWSGPACWPGWPGWPASRPGRRPRWAH